MSAVSRTLPGEFRRLAAERGAATVLRQKELGVWREFSWRDVAEDLDRVAAGLADLGIRPGEPVAIAANTCREWLLADLGAQGAGAVVAGLHVTDALQDIGRELAALGPRVLFLDDDEQFEALAETGDLAGPDHIVLFRTVGLQRVNDRRLLSLKDLLARGAQAMAAGRAGIDRLLSTRGAEDAAMLVYTAGATGRPKGVCLSHRAVMAAIEALDPVLQRGRAKPGERLLFQPLSHVMERVAGLYAALIQGAVLNFVESQDTVFDNLREVQPDVLLAVPRVWARLHSSLEVILREATPLQQWAYARALRAGEAVWQAREQGSLVPAATRLLHALGDRLVLANLRRMLGLDRLRIGVAGGAPLPPALVHWYRAMGIELRQAWGLTEMAGYVAIACASDPPDSVGRPLGGLEVRLSDRGEILVKGASRASGYAAQKAPALTQGEGQWLGTGDAGRIDAAGRLAIVGRLGEVIVTDAGDEVHPMALENCIKGSPYIADVVVVGHGRPHLSCLVMIDHEAVEQWAQDRQVPFSDFRSLCESPDVLKLIAQEIERHAGAMGQAVAGFRLIDAPAEADKALLTPSMKLKRWRVVERYGSAIA